MQTAIDNESALWERNDLQFPRLLAEITATQELNIDALCASMNLSKAEIHVLLGRAQEAWEKIKGDLGGSAQ